MDEILQNRLAALESGQSLDEVLAGLPPDAAELAPMIRMAARVHQTPSPTISRAAYHRQHGMVQAVTSSRPNGLRLPGWLTPKQFALGMMAMVVIMLALAAGLLIAGPVAAQSASLSNVTGIVEVAPSQNADWHFVSSTEQVRQGALIRTYAASSVTLVFYDGTRSTIGPDSDVTLASLGGGWGGALQVSLTQSSGATTNDVVPLRGSGSYFYVNTPSGRASVHGTSFDVSVNQAGESLFSVNHGIVEVSAAGGKVDLNAGQSTAVLPGQDPQAPGFQFTLKGTISAMVNGQWTINGVTFTVNSQTDVVGTYQVGSQAFVRGRILADGTWVADSILPVEDSNTTSRFTGTIDSMPGIPGTWVISGHNVLVDSQTNVDSGLKVGSPVQVTFVTQSDGSWLAKTIELLQEAQPTPTMEPTETEVTGTATSTEETGTPSVTPSVTETATGTGTPEATMTGTPEETGTPEPTRNPPVCMDNKQQPDGLRLAARFNVPYSEIIGWFCKGFGFGEIDLAYDLSQSSGMPVDQIFAMRESGLGWGQIKKQLAKLTAPTPMPTGTLEVTGTVVPTSIMPGNGNGRGNGNPHPGKP